MIGTRSRQALGQLARVAAGLCVAAPALGQVVPVPPAPAASEPRRETLAEFLDSLSDNILGDDRSQLYRTEGRKRIVTLRSGWTATLDEQAASRLANTGGGPGRAGPPGKSFELGRDTDDWRWRLYARKDSIGRENGASLAWQVAPGVQMLGHGFRVRDDDSGVKRRDAELGLRFGDAAAWIEPMLRRADLEDPRSTAAGREAPSAGFAGVRASWLPPSVPGLALTARGERTFGANTAPGDERLAEARVEIGADYRLDAPSWPGARVYWREALKLGLLASDGLDERTTYRRIVGGEVSDGTADGQVYLQWREHSLADPRNALLVAGWRHEFEPAPRWRLETLVERAAPMQGPSAIGSTTLGLRATQSAHPSHTLLAETEWVRSSIQDSAYGALKFTHRLSEHTLAAWRLSITDRNPHESGARPSTELKASAGWAWREPEYRRVYALSRYTRIERQLGGEPQPGSDDSARRAHILLGQAGGHWGEASEWSLRGTRRLERDPDAADLPWRTTNLFVARTTWPVYRRWSASAHVASRRDSAEGARNGLGAELGYRLSEKAALAIGWNLRGFNDSELELDERLKQGLTIRLRFSIDAAAARWLDPSMDAVRAAREAPP